MDPEVRTDAQSSPPRQTPRLRRSRSDRVVGGVCGGLGAYLGVDPVWLRIAFVALVLGAGSGVLLYIIAWIAIPESQTDEDVAYEPPNGAPPRQPALLVGAALIVVGMMLLLRQLVPWVADLTWPLVLVGIGLVIFLTATRAGDRS